MSKNKTKTTTNWRKLKMSIKQKLAMGILTGGLAISMIGGGTYAYFNDVETSTNTFAAGTLDLSLNPTEIISVDNIKPGDWMNRSFELKNDGTLDIAQVLLKTAYNVTDAEGDNVDDFGKHIRVNLMLNSHKPDAPVIWTTLADLENMTPDAVADRYFPNWGEDGGLTSGDSDLLLVQFEFVENGSDTQNQFQGDSLELKWEFEAVQEAGEEK